MHEYKKSFQEEVSPFVSLDKCRLVFNKSNLELFKPKKDQCKRCVAYKEMREEDNIKH